jgi:hypothetical protein
MARGISKAPSKKRKGGGKRKRAERTETKFRHPDTLRLINRLKQPPGLELVASMSGLCDLPKVILILTPEILHRHVDNHAKISGRKWAWVLPLTLMVPCLLALVTSEFQDRFGLSGATWRAVFFVSLGVLGGWLVWSAFVSVKAARYKTDVLSDIKSESTRISEEGLWAITDPKTRI